MSPEETVGRYRLTRKIATGGMAEIWLASSEGPEGFRKRLVVKKILPNLVEDEEFVRMFLDEARIAARLNHPNVVQIFDLGEADGTYFIAMEYVPGKDLRRVYQDSAKAKRLLPAPLIARILIESAKALDYAHHVADEEGRALRIVHRDVSPQNILVTFQGGVKIVDFGIAKAADQASHTRAGVLKGKYSYMSPEQAAGDAIDARTDIFALGIVGYELVTGFRLFKRENEVATLQAVRECKVAPPSTVSREAPRALDRVLLKALAKRSEDRYATAGQFALDLEEFLLEGHYPASSTHLAEFMREIYPEPEDESASKPPPPTPDNQSGSSARQVAVHAAKPPPVRTLSRPGVTAATNPIVTRPNTVSLRPPPPEPATTDRPWRTASDEGDPQSVAVTEPSSRSPSAAPERPAHGGAGTEAPTRVGPGLREQPTRVAATESPTRIGTAEEMGFPEDTPVDAPAGLFERLGEVSPRVGKLSLKLALGGLAVVGGMALLPAIRSVLARVPALPALPTPATGDAGCLLCGLLPGREGKLTVVTEPAGATVYLGHDSLGSTPVVEAAVASGHFVLRVVNEELALDAQVPVDVHPDKLTVIKKTFSEGTAAISMPKGHSYQVYFHDKALGHVPGPPIEMVEGTHVLTLVDEQTGAREQRTIEVKAARTRVHAIP